MSHDRHRWRMRGLLWRERHSLWGVFLAGGPSDFNLHLLRTGLTKTQLTGLKQQVQHLRWRRQTPRTLVLLVCDQTLRGAVSRGRGAAPGRRKTQPAR